MTDDLLCRRAVDLAALLRTRDLSAGELMEATLARIAAVNPIVIAVVTLVPEQALAGARAADAALAAPLVAIQPSPGRRPSRGRPGVAPRP